MNKKIKDSCYFCQQTLTIHPNNNRGTENNNQNNFDANGNLLHLDIAGLIRSLCVVFAAFAEDVTKPKCSKNTIATQAKKEMTIVVYATTVPDT
jgi:hypothetical protein